MIVKYILNGLIINGHHPVAGFQLQFFSNTSNCNFFDDMSLVHHFILSSGPTPVLF